MLCVLIYCGQGMVGGISRKRDEMGGRRTHLGPRDRTERFVDAHGVELTAGVAEESVRFEIGEGGDHG